MTGMRKPARRARARQKDERRRLEIETVSGQVLTLLETVEGGVWVEHCYFGSHPLRFFPMPDGWNVEGFERITEWLCGAPPPIDAHLTVRLVLGLF